MNLSTLATSWPTPRACSGKRSSGANRTEFLRLWPTAKACDGNKPSAGKRKSADLTERARSWATPSVADANGGRMRRSGDRSDELLLKGQAAMWATPSARDWKSGHASPKTLARNSRPLNEQTVNLHSHPDQAMNPAGASISTGAPTLNPLFVEALMGWPIGWTGFASAATEWCRWSRHMRGELSRLGWGCNE